jgi:general secretion pathway protein M
MTSSLPEGWRGRLLAMALNLAIVAVVWTVVAAPLLDWYKDRAEYLDERHAVARKMAEEAATLPALQAQAARADAAGPAPSAVLEGDTDAIAGAALQLLVRQMAAGSGVTLNSVEVLPAEAVDGYRRIGLRVALAARWTELAHLLASIEEASPRMLVDDLRIHGSPLRNAALPMDASLTVLAFRDVRAPANPPAGQPATRSAP